MLEPSSERALDCAKKMIEVIKGRELITVRVLNSINIILDELSKELAKDVESPLSSDMEISILIKSVDIRINSEKMECSSTFDNVLDASK